MEELNFSIWYASLCGLAIPREKWFNYLQTVETDQMPHSAASDLGLHCLPITLLSICRLKWFKEEYLVIILEFQK